jgi:hypothetical protein
MTHDFRLLGTCRPYARFRARGTIVGFLLLGKPKHRAKTVLEPN